MWNVRLDKFFIKRQKGLQFYDMKISLRRICGRIFLEIAINRHWMPLALINMDFLGTYF